MTGYLLSTCSLKKKSVCAFKQPFQRSMTPCKNSCSKMSCFKGEWGWTNGHGRNRYVCVCVCVWERERAKTEIESRCLSRRGEGKQYNKNWPMQHMDVLEISLIPTIYFCTISWIHPLSSHSIDEALTSSLLLCYDSSLSIFLLFPTTVKTTVSTNCAQ